MSDAIREAFEALERVGNYVSVPFEMMVQFADDLDTVKSALQSQTAPAVPEGWRIFSNPEGVICLENTSSGESILVPTYSDRGDLWMRVAGQFLRDMLTAAPQPEPLRFSDTTEEIEERLVYLDENACPHCGGSGHKDDVAQPDHYPDAGKVGARYALVTYNNGELHKPRDFWIEDTRTGERLYKGPSSFEAVNRESGELIVAALNSATPSVPEEEIASKAIAQFKDELVNSVKPIFRPHIEGVCAVVIDRLRTAGDDGEGV